MNRKKTLHAALAILLMAAGPVAAQDGSGWYITADVGLNSLGSEDLRYTNGIVRETASADLDLSFAGGGTVGFRLDERWRIEGELIYRRNELSAVTLPSLGAFSSGDFASLSLGASVLYDFDLFGSPNVRSYIGAGVVFIQEIDIDFERSGQETSFETDDIGFQLQLGARYDFGDRWFVDAGVRYLRATGIDMTLPADGSQAIRADYTPLTVTAGIGWRF